MIRTRIAQATAVAALALGSALLPAAVAAADPAPVAATAESPAPAATVSSDNLTWG
ncbi:hypothetical protein [Kitasatospora terrestris]|uniref:Uncharacterized protein n=1 Tax=Kitasatospora terrestris TaxID=258051 RepID=A0ABP9DEG7_9ACTN